MRLKKILNAYCFPLRDTYFFFFFSLLFSRLTARNRKNPRRNLSYAYLLINHKSIVRVNKLGAFRTSSIYTVRIVIQRKIEIPTTRGIMRTTKGREFEFTCEIQQFYENPWLWTKFSEQRNFRFSKSILLSVFELNGKTFVV